MHSRNVPSGDYTLCMQGTLRVYRTTVDAWRCLRVFYIKGPQDAYVNNELRYILRKENSEQKQKSYRLFHIVRLAHSPPSPLNN